ncbi:hypothetical protein NQZ68_027465, partial [Dissostichus eleginoides]
SLIPREFNFAVIEDLYEENTALKDPTTSGTVELTGFPVPQDDLGQFVLDSTNSPCGDDHFQEHFENLQRTS